MKQVLRYVVVFGIAGLLGGQLYIASVAPLSVHAEETLATPTNTPTPVVNDGDCNEVFC